jgi:hypothetical protein
MPVGNRHALHRITRSDCFIFSAIKKLWEQSNFCGLLSASNSHNKEAENFQMFRFLERNSAPVLTALARFGYLSLLP